ncbi:carbohydrate ABC transporter permease [Pseudonocardia sp. TRM90224]|uniref:carbohydrate ABC transporter permease n=1 Tax=Pseudonocardia sp. TRM90224 TaxID=2812678 RepID=UPI001E28ED57|nr:sugar ABC transporter permease [Pseudonocardia sp. TRM90224]
MTAREAVRAGTGRADTGRPWSSSGFWFVAPFGVLFVAFLAFPLLYGLWMSFTGESLTGRGGLVGLDNYVEAFTDPLVWTTLLNTLWFTVISTVPLVVIALVMALLVDLGLPGRWLWRLAFFAPYLLPVAAVALLWQFLYQPELGLINNFLAGFGAAAVPWLTTKGVAMAAVAATTVWWTVGFNFLLLLAGLQAIPQQLYEAAALDGAGGWRQTWSVTLPQLRRTLVLVAVLQVLASLKVFDQIYLMTTGGPDDSTRSVIQYIYDTGFTGYRLGYASAIAYVFFVVIAVISVAQLRLLRNREG